jgi:hypothetical protein
MNHNSITAQPISPIPADNSGRNLAVADSKKDQGLRHLGVVGGREIVCQTLATSNYSPNE